MLRTTFTSSSTPLGVDSGTSVKHWERSSEEPSADQQLYIFIRKEGAVLEESDRMSRSRGRPSNSPKLSASLEPLGLSCARLPATRRLKYSANAKLVKRGSCIVLSLAGGLSGRICISGVFLDCCSVSTESRTRWLCSTIAAFIYSYQIRQLRARELCNSCGFLIDYEPYPRLTAEPSLFVYGWASVSSERAAELSSGDPRRSHSGTNTDCRTCEEGHTDSTLSLVYCSSGEVLYEEFSVGEGSLDRVLQYGIYCVVTQSLKRRQEWEIVVGILTFMSACSKLSLVFLSFCIEHAYWHARIQY